MDPIQAVLALVPVEYALYAAALSALCGVLDAAFPQPAEGSPWVPLRRVVALLGANIRYARNAVQPGAVPAGVAVKTAVAAGAVERAVEKVAELRTTLDEAPK